MGLAVVGLIGDLNAITPQADAVVGIGQHRTHRPPADRTGGQLLKAEVGKQLGHQREHRRRLGEQGILQNTTTVLNRTEGEGDVLVAKEIVVDAITAAIATGIGLSGQLQDGGELQLHQVAAHLVGTVGQTAGMAVGGRAQQDRGAVDGAGRQHHLMAHEQPALAIHQGLDTPHLRATGVHMQPQHLGPAPHHQCSRSPGRIHPEQLRIAAGIRHGFRPALGQAIGIHPLAHQGQPQLLEEGFHGFGGQGVVATGPGLGGITAAPTVHAVEAFRLVVPGLEVAHAEAPAWRLPALEGEAGQFLLPQALQHPSPDLGVATEGVDRLGGEGIPIRAEPLLLGVVAILAEQIHIGHVLIGQGHLLAPLQQQHRVAGTGQGACHGATGCAAADDDDVVMAVVDDHG